VWFIVWNLCYCTAVQHELLESYEKEHRMSGCETWCVTVRGTVLRKMFGHRRDGVTADCVVKGCVVCCWPGVNRDCDEMGRAYGTCGGGDKCVQDFGGET